MKIRLVNLLMGLLLGLLLVACEKKDSPTATAEQYWDAITQGDELKRQMLVSNQRDKGVELYFSPEELSDVTFADAAIEGNFATLPTTLTVKDDTGEKRFTINTVLVREEERWKIDAQATRKAFVGELFSSTIDGLQKSLAETADEFRRIGEEIADTAAVEVSKASEQLKRDANEMSDEIQLFLEQIDQELVEELKKYSAQPKNN